MQADMMAKVRLLGFPERCKFNSLQEFLTKYPDMLAVDIPSSLFGAVVSKDEPGEDGRDRLWVRRDGSGNYVGTYAFQAGKWRPVYNTVPGEIIWLYGDSNYVPEGFTLIQTGDDAVVDSTTAAALMARYVPLPTGGYSYFAVLFTGYK